MPSLVSGVDCVRQDNELLGLPRNVESWEDGQNGSRHKLKNQEPDRTDGHDLDRRYEVLPRW